MQAYRILTQGGPPELADIAEPTPGAGQILVNIRACGLNFADLLMIKGSYQDTPEAPFTLGMEVAGVVDAVGESVNGFAPGDRVMVFAGQGGLAERGVFAAERALPLPEAMSFEDAAAIPEAFLTSYEALVRTAHTQPGETVLVHAAAGGVGSAAVQLAKKLGAKVVATAGSADKLARVKELGADVLVNYKEQDFVAEVKTATDGKGADVVLDFVGGSYWDKHADCLAVGGRVVVIGLLGGASAKVNLAQLLMRRYQILGLVMRSRPVADKVAITRAFSRENLDALAKGRLRPVVDRALPLAEARAAHEQMEDNANVGKIVLRVR